MIENAAKITLKIVFICLK